MNLDDLKDTLAAQDAKLDRALRLNETAVREIRLAKTKTSLRRLVWGISFELAMAAVAIVWLGNFLAEHVREPRFLVPAAIVHVALVALLGSCVRQLVAIANVDYGTPVVAVQKELGALRLLRVRTTKWTAILSFVLWFPALVVLFEAVFGADLWLILGAVGERDGSFFAWAVGNVLFGLAVAIGLVWLSNRYADREGRSPAIKWLADELAGRRVTEALASLDAIARFETEPRDASAGGEA